MRSSAAAGRALVLATATHQRYAQAIEIDDERPAAVRRDRRVAHDCGTITNSW
ncbi:hypothetical protein [Paraburkholderia atlantica]|uniref:hypothetical protein n=1 Tax=Paraburkholderia atlantica TaxID=2654982 RepID=UPI00138A2B07|nr:hypothetical protein [Paraburkholderia atlantica]MBB5507779.1 hypothetical protein [Paraburkholderia atlantica]